MRDLRSGFVQVRLFYNFWKNIYLWFVAKRIDNHFQDVFQRLPSYCSSRIRSVGELQKFLTSYPEFHGKPDLPFQPSSHGATFKNSNSADFTPKNSNSVATRQNTVGYFSSKNNLVCMIQNFSNFVLGLFALKTSYV